jgi:RecB family exonuclease
VGRLARLLRRAVARTDVEDQTQPSGGYRRRLERLRSSMGEDAAGQRAVQEAVDVVEGLLKITRRLPTRAGLLTYASVIAEVFEELCEPEAGARVLEQLLEWRGALERVGGGRGEVDLAALVRLLGRALAEVQLVPDDEPVDRAVELVGLPDLLGRSFDYVVIADAVHGRLPLAERSESLVSDGDRKLVNRAAGRRVLRLFEDDAVLEPGPVPPRQALEPLWFLGAVGAATEGLAITASARDDEGREVAPSSFLQEALIALGADPEARDAGAETPRVVEPRLRRMQIAHGLARGTLPLDVDVDAEVFGQVGALARCAYDRARFFDRAVDAPANPSAWSYRIDAGLVEGRLGRYLGLSAERPLAPTRLEAIASCPMRGFVEQLLRVDTEPEAGQDADARTLGTLAHEVLEKFYEERASDDVAPTRLERADRERLREIVDEVSAPLLEGRATGHMAALRASISWLKEALIRSVTVLAHKPPVPGARPTSFELKVGTRGWEDDPHGLPPVPIKVGDRTLFIGGEIDRVDEGDGRRVVVDYKNTTSAAVERKLKGDAVLETHFQLPLYLRLLEHHKPSPPGTQLCAYLIPLREGKVKTVLGEHLDFARRVVDDEREDGLAASMDRVVTPMLEGRVVPNEGNHCKRCRLSRVCRVPLAGTRLYDGPDPDEVLP